MPGAWLSAAATISLLATLLLSRGAAKRAAAGIA